MLADGLRSRLGLSQLDLLGAYGKLALPLMVTSLSFSQAVGSSLIGALADARGVTDALLPFVSIVGCACALSGVCLYRVLHAAKRRDGDGAGDDGVSLSTLREPSDLLSSSRASPSGSSAPA